MKQPCKGQKSICKHKIKVGLEPTGKWKFKYSGKKLGLHSRNIIHQCKRNKRTKSSSIWIDDGSKIYEMLGGKYFAHRTPCVSLLCKSLTL